MIEVPTQTLIEKGAEPLISVVLPVYNGEKYLAESIDSILAQTFADFELIMIDDGSTDGSRQILREYEGRDARVRVILRENRGLATTLNDSIDIATGAWIARMDQDDIALPQRFQCQLAWLKKTGADVTGSWAKCFGSWDHRICKGYQSDDAIKMDMLFKNPFFHSSIMMRRELIKKMRYDKCFEKAEDYDLWIRAAQAGWKMSNVPEVLLLYRKHGSQISTQSSTRQRVVREEARRKYWMFVTNLMEFRPTAVQEVYNLGQSHAKPDMDAIETILKELLLYNQGEARTAIMDNIFQLYLRVCAENSDVGARWYSLNKRFGSGFAPGMMFQLWIIKLFRIRYGDKAFDYLKKIYVVLFR